VVLRHSPATRLPGGHVTVVLRLEDVAVARHAAEPEVDAVKPATEVHDARPQRSAAPAMGPAASNQEILVDDLAEPVGEDAGQHRLARRERDPAAAEVEE